MIPRKLAIAIAISIFTVSPIALAQTFEVPNPARNGDYNSAETAGGYHSDWLVVSTRLNCRRAPGTNNQISRQFAKDDWIESDYTSRRNPISRDTQDKPWLRVQMVDNAGKKTGICFVRANSKYVQARTHPRN